MKYYSLFRVLLFLQHQYKNNFSTIKKIVETINDDNIPVEDVRAIILYNLRKCELIEEEYKEPVISNPSWIPPEDEGVLVMEEMQYTIKKRVYTMIFYLN